METTPKKTKLEEILPKLQFLPDSYKRELFRIEEFDLGLEATGTEKLERILFNYTAQYIEGREDQLPKEIIIRSTYSKIHIYYLEPDSQEEEHVASIDIIGLIQLGIKVRLKRTSLEERDHLVEFFNLQDLDKLLETISKLKPKSMSFRKPHDMIIREAETVLNTKYKDTGIYFEAFGSIGNRRLAMLHEEKLFPATTVLSIDRIKIGEVQVSSKFGGNFPIEIGEDGSYKEVVEYAVKAAKRTIDMISNVIALAKLDGRPFRIMMLEDILSVENPETKDVFIQAYYPSEIIYNRTTLDMNDLHLMSVVRAKEKAIESPYIFKDYQYCK